MKILLVEDEPDIRDYVRKALLLHDETVTVVEAVNGMDGVRVIAAEAPDGVILDMLMPDMDGWEFLQILEALNADLPVVILTAVQRDNAMLCGVRTTHPNVVDIENKPLDLEDAGRLLDSLRKRVEARVSGGNELE